MKKKKSKGKVSAADIDLTALPQNILLVGDRVLEDKNIYISQPTYVEIHHFTRDKTVYETGGILVGYTVEAFGKQNTVITGFIEAKFSEGTATTLKFTHETWDYVHKELERKYPGQKIMGWIHTHPDFGIFLSEYDKFIQNNFFNNDYQVAYVVDPVQDIEGFYFWMRGNIDRCCGFYLYDKTGTEITCIQKKPEAEPESKMDKFWAALPYAVICMLAAAVIIQMLSVKALSSRVTELEQSMNVNNSTIISYFEQRISNLETELSQYTGDSAPQASASAPGETPSDSTPLPSDSTVSPSTTAASPIPTVSAG